MRGADGGPCSRLSALPAVWGGLLYDKGARGAAWDMGKGTWYVGIVFDPDNVHAESDEGNNTSGDTTTIVVTP
mgnify:CR=1 FL=1